MNKKCTRPTPRLSSAEGETRHSELVSRYTAMRVQRVAARRSQQDGKRQLQLASGPLCYIGGSYTSNTRKGATHDRVRTHRAARHVGCAPAHAAVPARAQPGSTTTTEAGARIDRKRAALLGSRRRDAGGTEHSMGSTAGRISARAWLRRSKREVRGVTSGSRRCRLGGDDGGGGHVNPQLLIRTRWRKPAIPTPGVACHATHATRHLGAGVHRPLRCVPQWLGTTRPVRGDCHRATCRSLAPTPQVGQPLEQRRQTSQSPLQWVSC